MMTKREKLLGGVRLVWTGVNQAHYMGPTERLEWAIAAEARWDAEWWDWATRALARTLHVVPLDPPASWWDRVGLAIERPLRAIRDVILRLAPPD